MKHKPKRDSNVNIFKHLSANVPYSPEYFHARPRTSHSLRQKFRRSGMRICRRSLSLVALGFVLLFTAKSGKATVQRKARQIEEDFIDEDYDIPGSCPQGWIGHEGSCYLPYVHGATWQEAEDTCREIDAHLVLSRSDTENEFIAVEVGRPESRVWIGLRRKQGEFIWSDGQKAEYTNWGPREPKDSSVSGRDCVSLLPEDIFYSWEVTKCDSLQAFICERENVTGLGVTEDLLEVTKGPSVVTDWDTKDNVPTQKTPRTELVSVTSPVDVFTEVPTDVTDVGAKLEDKCSTGSHDCSSNGECIPRGGSYDCECNLGYEGDGRICADINECGNGYNDCHLNATCTNVPGSYHCRCKKGFVGSGKLCEAEGDDTKAPSTVASTNAYDTGSPSTFVSTETKETSIPTPPTPPIPPIPPTPPIPQTQPNAVVPTSTEETRTPSHTVSTQGTETKTPSFIVSSNAKETGTPTTVVSIEANETGVTPSIATETGMVSTAAEEEKEEKPTIFVSNRPGKTEPSKLPVVTEGGTADVGAQLLNRCSSGLHNCSSDGLCVPLDGSYECVCNLGFEGDGRVCADINECNNGVNDCPLNASCFNVPGSYYCQCHNGFTGSGKICEGIDLPIYH